MLATALLAAGCSDDVRISIDLVRAPMLVPRDDFQGMTIRVRDAIDGDLVAERIVPEVDIREGAELLPLDELETGEAYVLSIGAPAEDCSLRGRAYGRSLPFEHRDRDYRVAVQIGCADTFMEAPDTTRPRILASMTTDGRGRGLIAGGVAGATISPDGFATTGATDVLEQYDPRTGQFEEITLPHVAPPWPSLASYGDSGGAALVAGGGFLIPPCDAAAALIAQDTAVRAPALSTARCGGASVGIRRTRQVLVAGGQLSGAAIFDRTLDYELYREGTLEGTMAGSVLRVRPALVPLADGCSALIVGGIPAGFSGPQFEVFHAGGECGPSAPRLEAVAVAPLPPGVTLPDVWLEPAATYVPCESGGGAVYAVGGRQGYEPGSNDVYDTVWCWRDAPDSQVVFAGRLPHARSMMAVVAVEGRDDPRLLVIGGSPEEPEIAVPPAQLLSVQGCTCAPVDPTAATSPAVPLPAPPLLPAATLLGDGTVLATGATMTSMTGITTLTAAGGAVVFFADLEP